MKVECDLIRDLLPLYAEDMVSERSSQLIREHLTDCPKCRDIYQRMIGKEVQPMVCADGDSQPTESFRRYVRREKHKGQIKLAAGILLSFLAAVLLSVGILGGVFGTITLPLWISHVSEDASAYDRDALEGHSGFAIFPEELAEEQVQEYYYFYREGLFDADVQLYIQCAYSQKDFQAECERLEQAHVSYQRRTHGTRYNTRDYMLPAYEAIQGVDHTYEYALVDEEHLTIEYVFLQFVDAQDVVFEKEKLPYGYGRDYTVDDNLHPYDMYAFPREEGEYEDGYVVVYE